MVVSVEAVGQHELKKFKQCFRQIDLEYLCKLARRLIARLTRETYLVILLLVCLASSASGMIDYDEFFEFIDETKTPFSEGLFRMIDADSNGTVRLKREAPLLTETR